MWPALAHVCGIRPPDMEWMTPIELDAYIEFAKQYLERGE